jgi:hypothetical protein
MTLITTRPTIRRPLPELDQPTRFPEDPASIEQSAEALNELSFDQRKL